MSNFKRCSICGATWDPSGQLYWATGRPGKDIDLAALVCNRLTTEKAEGCMNPCKGQDGGIGWEERLKMTEAALAKFEL
jgi:hypothetical protein